MVLHLLSCTPPPPPPPRLPFPPHPRFLPLPNKEIIIYMSNYHFHRPLTTPSPFPRSTSPNPKELDGRLIFVREDRG